MPQPFFSDFAAHLCIHMFDHFVINDTKINKKLIHADNWTGYKSDLQHIQLLKSPPQVLQKNGTFWLDTSQLGFYHQYRKMWFLLRHFYKTPDGIFKLQPPCYQTSFFTSWVPRAFSRKWMKPAEVTQLMKMDAEVLLQVGAPNWGVMLLLKGIQENWSTTTSSQAHTHKEGRNSCQ